MIETPKSPNTVAAFTVTYMLSSAQFTHMFNLTKDCALSSRLSTWEHNFILGFRQRLRDFGVHVSISASQLVHLEEIEKKLTTNRRF